jgi:hypothetical protein
MSNYPSDCTAVPCKICGDDVLVAHEYGESPCIGDVYCGPCYYEYVEPYDNDPDY